MNKKFHRVIFNRVRGMRMAVQESASSAGKKACGSDAGSSAGAAEATTPEATAPEACRPVARLRIAGALFGVLVSMPSQAQIVANPMAPGALRPTILVAPNGIAAINITTPSASGVSRNQYVQFDVSGRGAIINNSRTSVQSSLGGWLVANPYLATGPARIIVNEVSSSNPSYINGPIEIAGQRAEFILANPSGISVNGGAFLNAQGVTLTTGVPQYNAFGGLDSYVVRGGTVSINGAGLDLSTTDYAAILARAVQVNASIHANDLTVVSGANAISADRTQITSTTGTGGGTGTGVAPAFALDVAALGGMYAKKITLIGTEAGLGVRNAGSIGASAGSLVVTASGRLENTGTLEGQSVQLASASSDIVNQGTIRQTSMAALALLAPTLSNTNGGWVGAEPVPAASSGTSSSTGSGNTGATGSGTGGSASSSSATTGGTTAPATATIEPGSITAAGAIQNDGGKIYAGGPISLQAANLINSGGTLSVASLALRQPSFSNQGGTVNVSGALSANLGVFDNAARRQPGHHDHGRSEQPGRGAEQ